EGAAGARDREVGVLGGPLRGLGEDLLRPGVPHVEALTAERLDLFVVDDVAEELGAHDWPSLLWLSAGRPAGRSAMVVSPAAKCSVGISLTRTRTLSLGATPVSTIAWVTAEIIERMVSGERPSVRVTWTIGTSLAPVDADRAEVGEVAGDRRSGGRELGVGHAAGEHDPAGLDGVTALGQVVGRERECLARVALHGRAGRRVDDLPVDLDEDRLEGEVELARGKGDGPGDV